MKERIKLIIVFILGIMISVVISVYAATVITGKEVSYTDNKSIGASNVQDAIDGTYTKANTLASSLSAIKTLYSYSGAIFITKSASVTSSTLNAAFGGTWSKVSTGRVLLGAGSNGTTSYTAGSTGGSETHQHDTPIFRDSIVNSIYFNWNGNQYGVGKEQVIANGAYAEAALTPYPGNKTGYASPTSVSSNMPPYYVIYVWERS